MTNQERVEQMRKKLIAIDQNEETSGESLVYDRENRCWRVMPKTEATRKGYLQAKPEDMKVSAPILNGNPNPVHV